VVLARAALSWGLDPSSAVLEQVSSRVPSLLAGRNQSGPAREPLLFPPFAPCREIVRSSTAVNAVDRVPGFLGDWEVVFICSLGSYLVEGRAFDWPSHLEVENVSRRFWGSFSWMGP
jgi:hypothetical protein